MKKKHLDECEQFKEEIQCIKDQNLKEHQKYIEEQSQINQSLANEVN